MKDTLPYRVRLGAFEVDLRAGVVRTGERSVCLQGQPFSVLRMLVERGGEIVTRDEIHKKLWPNDTVVDFDQGINAAIRKLRQVLGDSAETPTYIETVARRGYRLLLPVERLGGDDSSDPALLLTADPSTPLRSARDDKDGTPHSKLADGSLIGKKVSHYRVLEVVGGGGMGMVYKAEDLKLGRCVAVKFLPSELADDAVALQRFEREAKTASSLNHLNICTIYEIEEYKQQPFIVMELLEGETLRDRLAANESKALPVGQVLDIAIQVCNGLQAAHEKGIIHRDIKPANIFLTGKGVVKILDFGLAKLVEMPTMEAPGARVERGFSPASADPLPLSSRATRSSAAADDRGVEGPAFDLSLENADPSTARPPVPQKTRDGEERGRSAQDDSIKVAGVTLTRTGAAMGTAGYMSPEQVRGEKLDARTDLFSFGLVLYEMASGRRAFSADTAAVVQDAILNQAPTPAHDVNPTIPPKLEQIINRAIEKDRELRYPSAAEMQAEIQSLVGQPSKRRARPRWKWLTAVAVICVAVIAVGVYWRSHRPRKLTDKDTIVVGDFDNKTGDAIFDDMLKQALSLQLKQSPFLDLLSERKVNAALKMMGHSAGDRLTLEVTREVCQRTRSKGMVTGSITEVGSQYVIGVKAVDCNMGGVLAEVQERAANKEGLLNALDAASISLRSRLGESMSSVEKYATPLREATTPSLEALRAYSQGLKVEYAKGMTAGQPFFKRAIEIDPNFALAYNSLSITYASQIGRMQEYARKAFELRSAVSERERFHIEANYYTNVTGELEKAAKLFEQWQQSYPRDAVPYSNLGVVYGRLGNLDKALEEAREAMRLETNSARVYANLGESYIPLNRLDEAEAVYKQMEERKLVNESLLTDRYQIAFLKGDTAQMAQLAAAGMGKAGEDGLPASQAQTEAWYGKLKNARVLTQRAVDLAERNDAKDVAAEYRAGAALREAVAGNRKQARADTNLAMMLAPNRDVQAIAPLALALAGDVVEAQRLAAELDKAFPLDTLVQRYWLPTIRAAIALERKDPNRAVEPLQVTSAIELGQAGGGQIYLCPVYLRGEAYLMLRNGRAAAAEFRKFIEHYGLVGNFPWGALAHLGLARAYAMEAETDPTAREKARTAYQNFLTLWKDADPDIPIYKQAKAEYAKLK